MDASRSSGFTIVEIGVIVPVLMLIVIGIFSIMFTYLVSSSREQARLDQTYARSQALDRIEADVRLSASFLTAEDSSLNDPYQTLSSGSGGWSYAGNGSALGNNNDNAGHRVLILREYATAGNPQGSVRQPVYVRSASAPDCSTQNNITGPLTYDIIYFVYGSTLYKRVVTNPTVLACVPQYQKVSCPPNTVLGAAGVGMRDPSCAADDEVVANGVSGLTVDYYANQGASSPLDAYNSPAVVPTADSVNVTIITSTQTYGGTVTGQSSLESSSQNGASS